MDINDNMNDINVFLGGAAGHKKESLNYLSTLMKKCEQYKM